MRKKADILADAMHTSNDIMIPTRGTVPSGRSARIAWLVLLALATLQLAIAQHASAHALDNLSERCAYCVHLDDCGQALNPALPAAVPAAAETPGPSLAAAVCERRPLLAPRSRAPPSWLIDSSALSTR